jgi:hypothetical protein
MALANSFQKPTQISSFVLRHRPEFYAIEGSFSSVEFALSTGCHAFAASPALEALAPTYWGRESMLTQAEQIPPTDL